MDVDAMDELMYDTLIRYFKTLAHTGYKSYDAVFKMLVMDFIYEITHTELRYYITNKDIKLMQDLLYQFFGSTCEISFPTNNRPCCVCVCCNGEGSTPPPIVVPTTTTTTSTRPPVEPAYLILSSTVAKTAYVDYGLVEMQTPISVEVGSKVTIQAQVVIGYAFKGFYVEGSLISSSNVLQYTIPSAGTNTIELRYEEEANTTTTTSSQPPVVPTTTTTSTLPPPVEYYMVSMVSDIPCNVTGNFGRVDISGEVTSDAKRLSIESNNVPSGTITTCSAREVGYVFKGIYNADDGSLLTSSLPFSWTGSKSLRFKFEQDAATTTTTTTSTSPSPVIGNKVYYGVVENYMTPSDFVDTPIYTLIGREGTKSRTITGTEVNEFTIPQTGYYSYLIIPKDKVELLYAAFTSSGITTVYYDSTKENILNDTNNGAFYSKYTRGGVNANQGGPYNGINYDVYFAYLASGGANIPINVQAKNK